MTDHHARVLRGPSFLGTALGVLLAAAALTGCVAAAGPAIETSVEIPESWPHQAGTPETTETAEPMAATADDPSGSPAPEIRSWWSRFEDESLDQVIRGTLHANRDLDAAVARLDASLAQARMAGADLKPQIGASLDGARRRQNFIGLPIPGAEDSVLTNTSTTLAASLNLTWEADLWGRLGSRKKAAIERAQAAADDLEALELSLSGQAAKAWFGAVEAAWQRDLAVTTLDNRERVRTRIENRYQAGLKPALELRLALADEAAAAAAVAGRERGLELATRRLAILSGRAPEVLAVLEDLDRDNAALPAPPPPPLPELPAAVLAARPDLAASERRLTASGLDVTEARAALYPQIRLTASAGRTSTELKDLLDSDFSVWSLAAGLLQPVVQGGRLRANVDRARALQRQALAEHEGLVLRALSEIQGELSAGLLLAAQHEAVSRSVAAAEAARELAEDRYFSGLAAYLTVLDSQRSATAAASELLATERRLLEQRVDLYLALGGSAYRPRPEPVQSVRLPAGVARPIGVFQ